MGVRSMLSTSRTAAESPSLNWSSLPQDRPWTSGPHTAQAGMLRRYRRLFAVAAFLLLATPLAMGILRPDSPELIYKEGRRLAPQPAAPDGLEAWMALPGQIDAYLKDHFGFRHLMIQLHKDLTRDRRAHV